MTLSSRQRMLAALECREPDQTPCSFMLFKGLWAQSESYLDFVQRQLDLGLDAYVQLPPRPPGVSNDYYNLHGLPVSYAAQVEIEEWVERPAYEGYPILVKEYHTPAGVLRTEVRSTPDWRWGQHVPFLDDYLVGRSRKFLIESEEDLQALGYLLAPPTGDEVIAFQRDSEAALAFARQHDLLLTGGWGVGADLIGWVYGLQNMLYAVFDKPGFVRELLEMIAVWNRARMQVVLDAGVDLYIKRAWYENNDFWTPDSYRQFIAPILEADVALAHSMGAKFGYIITSNCMPLLDQFAELGIDVLIGVDPAHWDMALAKEKLAGKVCLWGGVNGHLTVERGDPEAVRAEVRQAMQTLAPGGGFILSPVDNVREYNDRERRNVEALSSEWRELFV